MSVVVSCKKCEKKLRAPPSMLGKRVKCPGCGHGVEIPGNEQAPEAASVPEEEIIILATVSDSEESDELTLAPLEKTRASRATPPPRSKSQKDLDLASIEQPANQAAAPIPKFRSKRDADLLNLTAELEKIKQDAMPQLLLMTHAHTAAAAERRENKRRGGGGFRFMFLLMFGNIFIILYHLFHVVGGEYNDNTSQISAENADRSVSQAARRQGALETLAAGKHSLLNFVAAYGAALPAVLIFLGASVLGLIVAFLISSFIGLLGAVVGFYGGCAYWASTAGPLERAMADYPDVYAGGRTRIIRDKFLYGSLCAGAAIAAFAFAFGTLVLAIIGAVSAAV